MASGQAVSGVYNGSAFDDVMQEGAFTKPATAKRKVCFVYMLVTGLNYNYHPVST